MPPAEHGRVECGWPWFDHNHNGYTAIGKPHVVVGPRYQQFCLRGHWNVYYDNEKRLSSVESRYTLLWDTNTFVLRYFTVQYCNSLTEYVFDSTYTELCCWRFCFRWRLTLHQRQHITYSCVVSIRVFFTDVNNIATVRHRVQFVYRHDGSSALYVRAEWNSVPPWIVNPLLLPSSRTVFAMSYNDNTFNSESFVHVFESCLAIVFRVIVLFT